MTNITQKEIARRLGVSASLVSRALTGTAGDIGASPRTIARIRAEAARLNYQPSATALSLRGDSTRTLGVVIKNFDDPFFGRIIAELQSLAMVKRYSLLLTGCSPGAGSPVDVRSLAKYQLDGLIIAGSDFVPDGVELFVKQDVRVVRIGCGAPISGVVSVTVDLEHGFQQLVAYLTQLGHRDIGFLGDDTPSNLRREKWLAATLKRAKLVARSRCFVRATTTGPQAGYDAMQVLLRQCGDLLPTAVVAAEDTLAQTALRALFERQLQVPRDMTLVGVDDVPAAQMTIPSLTTLRQPIPAMVRAAFEQVTRSGKVSTSEISIQPELVVRESSAAPAPRREPHDD